MEIYRLDSEAVARENQSPCILRPNRERKHAAQTREAIFVPSQKSPQNYLGVAAGFEFFSVRFQFRAQFAVVVNLAVEDQDGVSVLADHGLVARVKVDDFEAHGPQRDNRRFIRALLVRTSMNQRIGGRVNAPAVEGTVSMGKPGYAAQMTVTPSRGKKLVSPITFSVQPTCSPLRIVAPSLGCSGHHLVQRDNWRGV